MTHHYEQVSTNNTIQPSEMSCRPAIYRIVHNKWSYAILLLALTIGASATVFIRHYAKQDPNEIAVKSQNIYSNQESYDYYESHEEDSRNSRPEAIGYFNVYIREDLSDNNRRAFHRYQFPAARYNRHRLLIKGPFLNFQMTLSIFVQPRTHQTIIYSPRNKAYLLPALYNKHDEIFSIGELISSGYVTFTPDDIKMKKSYDITNLFYEKRLTQPGLPKINPSTGAFTDGIYTKLSSSFVSKYSENQDDYNRRDSRNPYYHRPQSNYNDRPVNKPRRPVPIESKLIDEIQMTDVMKHLNKLQKIVSRNGDTLAPFRTSSIEATNYIYEYMSKNTNFKVTKRSFETRKFIRGTNPKLATSINSVVKDRNYSTVLYESEFAVMDYSRAIDLNQFLPLNVIPNLGCDEEDWIAANPSPVGQIALVKRGICTFAEKAAWALKYGARAILIYNDGVTADRTGTMMGIANHTNEIPALFLTYYLGQELVTAVQQPSSNVKVRLSIYIKDDSIGTTENICADTLTGDSSQTIIIGAHTDSIDFAPGLNDNGSGVSGILALAEALFRLYQTSTHAQYKYRVRFCWWAALYLETAGSTDYVNKAKESTIVGERLNDHLVYFNYDTIGSSNFMFGINNSSSLSDSLPNDVYLGIQKVTKVYEDWFIKNNLPWDPSQIDRGSDDTPFYSENIVVGGLYSGEYDIKTDEQRERYQKILGNDRGGVANTAYDPCVAVPCDTIQNINLFALETNIKAAAHALEYVGKQKDLKNWLFPSTSTQRSAKTAIKKEKHKFRKRHSRRHHT